MDFSNKLQLFIALSVLLSILTICVLLNNWFLHVFLHNIHNKPPKPATRSTKHLLSSLSYELFPSYPPNKKKVICSDSKIIDHLQRGQWLKAVAEVFEGKVFVHINDKDLGFYRQNQGGLAIHLSSIDGKRQRNESRSLVYHRILNSANHVIQSLLLEFAYRNSGQTNHLSALSCMKQENCAHKDIQFLSSASLQHFLVHQSEAESHLSFTFVRDPIQRFLAAFTDIDILQTKLKGQGKIARIPFKQPRKSMMRFMEFIDHILIKGPSSSLFKEYEQIGINMIAPMIGTISQARSLEVHQADSGSDHHTVNHDHSGGGGLHIYHYERFLDDWQSLANLSGLLDLASIASHRNRDYYEENLIDLRRNSTIASMFLATADEDAKERFAPHGFHRLPIPPQYNHTAISAMARKYLSALCRMYIIDYLCTDYQLPRHCQGIFDEVHRQVTDIIQPSK